MALPRRCLLEVRAQQGATSIRTISWTAIAPLKPRERVLTAVAQRSVHRAFTPVLTVEQEAHLSSRIHESPAAPAAGSMPALAAQFEIGRDGDSPHVAAQRSQVPPADDAQAVARLRDKGRIGGR